MVISNETAVMLVRILRDLCHRIPTWQPLGQWVSVSYCLPIIWFYMRGCAACNLAYVMNGRMPIESWWWTGWKKKVQLFWTYLEEKRWQRYQTSTTVATTRPQRKRKTKEHLERRLGERYRLGRCPEILKYVLKLELGPEICTYILKFSRIFTIFTRDGCTGRYCWERVLAMGILSVRPSVCLSQPGGIPSSGEIETPGLHHMVAWCI